METKKSVRRKTGPEETGFGKDIAVIGMACRFPDARTYDEFWTNLEGGVNSIKEVPADRWDWRDYYGDVHLEANKTNSKWAGFIDDADKFDASFFNISPQEAECTDPQQRMMLELTWACLEDAGYRATSLDGSNTGVYVGVCNYDYKELQDRRLRILEGHFLTGTAINMISNRISYLYNFHGPSVSIDTACSSSLIALHDAVQALRIGSCDLAFAGGVNLIFCPERNIPASQLGMFSSTGRCHTFDERADGYVRGEGAGIVLLKRLEEARRDGDRIVGIIKGVGVNHGGRARTLTAPNPFSQANVIEKACRDAGVSPATITYIEAHGTGTPLGDPIEILGLKRAFENPNEKLKTGICGIGAVKTNIGHLEGAAGIAGIIKALLCLRHKKLVPLHGLDRVNPKIKLDESPFYLIKTVTDWRTLQDPAGNTIPRRAGVSSFGFGGANAHVVLEEYSPEEPGRPVVAPTVADSALIVLSAVNKERLTEQVRQLVEAVRNQYVAGDLPAIAYTLQTGREAMEERLALVVGSLKELDEKLTAYLYGSKTSAGLYRGETKGNQDTFSIFSTDEALRDVIDTWIATKKYDKLAAFWVKGLAVDWKRSYGDQRPQRITLPTYPFARERYWLPVNELPETALSAPVQNAMADRTTQSPGSPLPGQEASPADEKAARSEKAESPVSGNQSIKTKKINGGGRTLEQWLTLDLKDQAGRILKVAGNQLTMDDNLADFGFDSIGLTKFSTALTKRYGIRVSPSLFFGHSTLESLTRYFSQEHREVLQGIYQATIVEPEAPVEQLLQPEATSEPNQAANIPSDIPEPIAVIGMSGRFPEARTIDDMWSILTNEREVLRDVPNDRPGWRSPGRRLAGETDLSAVKGGWVPGVDEFDPLFFEISPREAAFMDPRQRLLLQEAWKALEDAGYGPKQLKNTKIGMFVGVEQGDYSLLFKEERGTVTANHDGVLAARLAYFLNFSGPVMGLNTACSSGLVAVHQACQSLRHGECDTVVAAGVNLMLTPYGYSMMQEAGMLSTQGACFAFDKRADGMVPAEAVAVVVLKRLSQAEADGDPIRAVICGNGINYDGKTNGITAPNGVLQAELLRTIYDRHRINPEEIDYIVTHGTGTKLGDPVEVNALNEAFGKYTRKRHFCALTSTKTNLGHPLGASGLVSLISLVKALEQEIIPGSLHCEYENEFIDWQASPFYVNKKTKAWNSPKGADRIGAVSAFGVSGTNAHVVLRSYTREQATPDLNQAPCFLLSLSAKTPEALQDRIGDLLDFLRRTDQSRTDLTQISYTLLNGRQHFAWRCAVVVADREDALRKLEVFRAADTVPGMYRNKVARDFIAQENTRRRIENLLDSCRIPLVDKEAYGKALHELADFYCQGYEVSGDRLYGGRSIRRASLPTYPFARENYWLPADEASGEYTTALPAVGHPLVQFDTSDGNQSRFSSRFTGQEFFLADYVVQGRPMLPAVAYLEMARAAVSRLKEAFLTELSVVRLKNVAWIRPFMMDRSPMNLHVSFEEANEYGLQYQIYGDSPEAGISSKVLYHEGRVEISLAQTRPTLDLSRWQAHCRQRSLTGKECYALFRSAGIDYGISFRSIEHLYLGATAALVKLSLPTALEKDWLEYGLHPGIMSGALQGMLGLAGTAGYFRPVFGLDELVFHDRCPASGWALVRYGSGNSGDGRISSYDIDICDEVGKVCVQLKGLSTRSLKKETDDGPSAGIMVLQPHWQKRPLPSQTISVAYAKQLVLLCEPPHEIDPANVQSYLGGARCRSLRASTSMGPERYERYAIQLLEEIQSLFRERSSGKLLLQVVFSGQQEQETIWGLNGLLKTAQSENPFLVTQLIEVDGWPGPSRLAEQLIADGECPSDDQIRYRAEGRLLLAWTDVKTVGLPLEIPWRTEGVYLITGGMGGLGLLSAREIIRQAGKVTLILTGRSRLSQAIQANMQELIDAGATVRYHRVDVSRPDEVTALFDRIISQFGKLNGIIHSAGIIRDGFIHKKEKKDVAEVFAPKVKGLVNLDEASKTLRLDFFILFSSVAGVVGNAGQVDYAAANAFMDAYAAHRHQLVAVGRRWGRTLSINWPLWKEGGMRVSKEIEDALAELGLSSLRTSSGLQALYQGFGVGGHRLMILEGDVAMIRQKILSKICYSPDDVLQAEATPAIQQKESSGKPIEAADFVRQAVARRLSVDEEEIDLEARLDEFGLGTIDATFLVHQFNEHFSAALTVNQFLSSASLREFALRIPAGPEQRRELGAEVTPLGDNGSVERKTAQSVSKAVGYLKNTLASAFGLSADRIEADAPVEEYGLDSLTAVKVTKQLEKQFGPLSVTLFFTHRTLNELAVYLVKAHPDIAENLSASEPIIK